MANIILVRRGQTEWNRIERFRGRADILLGVPGLGNELFWRIKQDICAINVFEIVDGEATRIPLNDTCHLFSIPG